MSQKLIIVRHARSTNNIRKTHVADPELSDFGVKQAKDVGAFLAKHVDMRAFNYYTSPYLRCLQTAWHIENEVNHSKQKGCRFYVENNLSEYINHFGRDASIKVHKERYPSMNWGFIPQDADHLSYKDEYNEAFMNRMNLFYNTRVASSSYGQNILVVTHGLPALLLAKIAENPSLNSVPIWDHSLDNASITLLIGRRVVWYGRHLYHELDYDPFDTKRSFDAADLLVPPV